MVLSFFNVILFSIGAVILGIEIAMYSILTYFSASKTIDYLIYGIDEYMGVFIISKDVDALKRALLNDLRLGVTVFNGKRGYMDSTQDILFCVITRFELSKLKATLNKVDTEAFVAIHKLSDAIGGLI
mgnify:FL=1